MECRVYARMVESVSEGGRYEHLRVKVKRGVLRRGNFVSVDSLLDPSELEREGGSDASAIDPRAKQMSKKVESSRGNPKTTEPILDHPLTRA